VDRTKEIRKKEIFRRNFWVKWGREEEIWEE